MKTIFNYAFVTGIVMFIAGGFFIVAVQIFGIVTSNGQLSTFVMESIAPPIYGIAAITGLISFFKGYVEKWESSD